MVLHGLLCSVTALCVLISTLCLKVHFIKWNVFVFDKQHSLQKGILVNESVNHFFHKLTINNSGCICKQMLYRKIGNVDNMEW